jgi:DNA polymerase-4
MANDVWAWCEKANSRGRTVTVKIKWADFQLSTRTPIDGNGDPNKARAA